MTNVGDTPFQRFNQINVFNKSKLLIFQKALKANFSSYALSKEHRHRLLMLLSSP